LSGKIPLLTSTAKKRVRKIGSPIFWKESRREIEGVHVGRPIDFCLINIRSFDCLSTEWVKWPFGKKTFRVVKVKTNVKNQEN